MLDRNPIVFLFSIISLVGSIFSFSLVYDMGLSNLLEMRTLNIIFLVIGIVGAVNFSLKSTAGKKRSYRAALLTGIQISLFTAVLFAAYLFLVSNVDDQFSSLLAKRHDVLFGLGAWGLTITSFLELLFSGVVITIAYLQFQKDSFFRSKVLSRLQARKA